jgi:hypothetical protein
MRLPRKTGVPLAVAAGTRPQQPYQPREAVPITHELLVRYLKEELRAISEVVGRISEELANLRALHDQLRVEHDELKARYDAHTTHPPPA